MVLLLCNSGGGGGGLITYNIQSGAYHALLSHSHLYIILVACEMVPRAVARFRAVSGHVTSLEIAKVGPCEVAAITIQWT